MKRFEKIWQLINCAGIGCMTITHHRQVIFAETKSSHLTIILGTLPFKLGIEWKAHNVG